MCTSSNARAVLEWALAKGDKVLFFPDQHLGRNTGFTMGYGEADMRVWNPHHDGGGLEERDVKDATLLLWKGHCSVHQRFRPAHVEAARAEHPGIEIIVHPECAHDVVEIADRVGSTERIQEWVRDAPAGASLAIGTEIHMVQRLAREHADKTIVSLDPLDLPVLDDVPHRRAAPRVGAREPRRRDGREPDRRRRRHRGLGPHRARADARHHLTTSDASCGPPSTAGAGSSPRRGTRARGRGTPRAASAPPCVR